MEPNWSQSSSSLNQFIPVLDESFFREGGKPAITEADIRTREKAQDVLTLGELRAPTVIRMELVKKGLLTMEQRRIGRIRIISKIVCSLR